MTKLELLIRDWKRKADTHNLTGNKCGTRFDLGYAAGIELCISDLKITMPFLPKEDKEDA